MKRKFCMFQQKSNWSAFLVVNCWDVLLICRHFIIPFKTLFRWCNRWNIWWSSGFVLGWRFFTDFIKPRTSEEIKIMLKMDKKTHFADDLTTGLFVSLVLCSSLVCPWTDDFSSSLLKKSVPIAESNIADFFCDLKFLELFLQKRYKF